MTPGTRQRDRAAAYARRGIAVFPIHGVRMGVCTCGSRGCARPGKHPRTRHGVRDATHDAATVCAWWRRWPDANVGCALAPSGLCAVDVDVHEGGPDGPSSLRTLEHEHGRLPATVTVQSGSGGRHYYFRAVQGLRHLELAPGVELLVTSCSLPPSVTTGPYLFLRGGDVADLPDWIAARCRPTLRPRRDAAREPAPIRGSAYGAAALAGEIAAVRAAPVGTRNRTLNRSAFVLGQLVAAGALSEADAAAALEAAAIEAGLPQREALATIQSGLRAGLSKPRQVSLQGASR